MNGHGHGVLLLQDLEDEDDDLEYQTSYSTSAEVSTSTSFSQLSPQNGTKSELLPPSDLLQVPKNPRLLAANVPNPSMLTVYPSRRKSLSAEPPWVQSSPVLDGPRPYQNGYLNPCSNTVSTHSLPIPDTRDNAITVAPSRNSLLEPNVFAGGRSSSNNHNHHHHKKHNHRKHKGRNKSPGRNSHSEGGEGSILDRIDNSILKKFGDWSNVEDDGRQRGGCGDNVFRSNSNNSKTNTLPYYFPKRMGSTDEEFSSGGGGGQAVNGGLPKLFKNYDSVVQNSKQVLTDKSFKIALSKDNNDPNSILSEAKRTLSRFGGQEFD